LLAGIGTVRDLEHAYEMGWCSQQIAARCKEASASDTRLSFTCRSRDPATSYVGVYFSILRLAEKASADYRIEVGIILADVGQRSMGGEQENMIADIALLTFGRLNIGL
jgi:hypothetical protein